MGPQIWVKSEEKWAYILMLRDHEVHCLKITGNVLTLKKNVQNALEALQQGRAPSEVGAKSLETLDTRKIAQASVDPGNASLTLKGEGDNPQSLTFSSADSKAGEILQAILAQSGRNFQPAQEEISFMEAIVPPLILGAICGALWAAVYFSAADMEGGKEVEVKGFRRRGLQRMAIWVAQLLGTNGTIALGIGLAVLFIGWAAMRIIRRPERTVWRPQIA
jgi:hypothetical protein